MRGRLRVWLVMRRIPRVLIVESVAFLRARSRVPERGLVRVLITAGLPVFFSYMEALYVRPGLTFELAPGFAVGAGVLGGNRYE